MRFNHVSDNNETWWVPITIPARELFGLLPQADRSRYLEFEIHLHVEVTPTIEGGVFKYAHEWALPPVGNYPKRIIEAIEKYMCSISVEEKFGAIIRSVIWRR